MAGLADLGKNTIEFAVGFALGHALGPALEPLAVSIAQEAFAADPSRAVPFAAAAIVAAEGLQTDGWAEAEAQAQGIASGKMASMIEAARTAPATGELMQMLRRSIISEGDFSAGLRKARLQPKWDAHLLALREVLLSPADLAMMRQQGFVTPEQQYAESALQGVTQARADLLYEISGLPPGAVEAMQLFNRGVIGRDVFDQMIREGHTKTKYTDEMFALRRRLLDPHQYAELRLRGWIDVPTRDAGAALSGMEAADVALLEKMLGRPEGVHAVTTGLARGGKFGGEYEGVPSPYAEALRESNVRPEWGNLAYANRYTLPSAFVIRALLKDGVLTAAEAEQIFLESGWPPALAKLVAEHGATSTATAKHPFVTKAEGQLWATIHKSYVAGESDDGEAQAALAALQVPDADHGTILALWQHEREIVRRTLTPTQLKKAWKDAKLTRDETVGRLERLGYNSADANLFLDE